MSNIISNTDFSDIPAFVDAVKEALESSIPPISFSIDNKENVGLFVQFFQSNNGYLGRRIACKHALSGSIINFTVKEIYQFKDERFPITLSFKQKRDVEDFANGWLRFMDEESKLSESVEDTQPKEQEPKSAEQKPSMNNPVEETKKSSEYDFIKDISSSNDNKQETMPQSSPQQYAVNPMAEDILDTILKINLILGWVLALAALVGSIVLAASEELYFIIVLGILAGALILLITYLIWARFKVIINISRNLFNINSKLKEKEQ
jgi:hypothetical protein